MPNERVLVVPTELITFQGLSKNYRQLGNLFHDHGKFMDRNAAEKDEHFRQVIPYVCMTFGDKIMNYTRGGQGTESRLHNFRSIGIGGHVNPFHGVEDYPITAFTHDIDREVEEEVFVDAAHRGHSVALLSDNSTAVNRVHLGVVFHWWLSAPRVRSREGGKIVDVQWMTAKELLSLGLESWSRLVLTSGVLNG
jgi:predicted NUDIX family phosphoesterase